MVLTSKNRTDRYASIFSYERFGIGTIGIFVLLALMSILLYKLGFRYFVLPPVVTAVLIFAIKSIEVIRVEKPESVQLIGKRCLVVRRVRRAEGGVVRLFSQSGELEAETWSAEAEDGETIEVGTTAKVTGMRNIFLLIKSVS